MARAVAGIPTTVGVDAGDEKENTVETSTALEYRLDDQGLRRIQQQQLLEAQTFDIAQLEKGNPVFAAL